MECERVVEVCYWIFDKSDMYVLLVVVGGGLKLVEGWMLIKSRLGYRKLLSVVLVKVV